jgi:hypothetical protein
MKLIAAAALAICLSCSCLAADHAEKPSIKVDTDGFPRGRESPEGAAVDLARAFIARNEKLFLNSCIPPFGAGESRGKYEDFLARVATEIRDEAVKKEASTGGPEKIGKVFAARHLSAGGPASYGYAAFDFQDIMFVDVGVFLHDGGSALNRTLVIKDKGNWYVHPAPELMPLLSMGLNDEGRSSEDFSQAYEVLK